MWRMMKILVGDDELAIVMCHTRFEGRETKREGIERRSYKRGRAHQWIARYQHVG